MNNKIISYVYDEMTLEQREQFELELNLDEELKGEYMELLFIKEIEDGIAKEEHELPSGYQNILKGRLKEVAKSMSDEVIPEIVSDKIIASNADKSNSRSKTELKKDGFMKRVFDGISNALSRLNTRAVFGYGFALVIMIAIVPVLMNSMLGVGKSASYDSAPGTPMMKSESMSNGAGVGMAKSDSIKESRMMDKNAAPAMAPASVDQKSISESANIGVATNSGANQNVKPNTNSNITMNNTNQIRKIIYRADINILVTNYQAFYDGLNAELIKQNGYIENMNIGTNLGYDSDIKGNRDYKYGTFVIRVPVASFNESFGALKTLGKVRQENISSDDISMNYADTLNAVKNLEVREEALRKLMDKAEKMEDIVKVDSELARVRGQIDSYKSTLNVWDNQVEMSTIVINFNEVKTIEPQIEMPESLSERIKNALIRSVNSFVDDLENILIGLFSNMIQLFIWAVVLFIIFKIIKKIKKNLFKKEELR